MERLMKVLVVLLVVCCVGVSQGSNFSILGGDMDWHDLNNWQWAEDAGWSTPPDRLPADAWTTGGTSDYVTLENSSPANPTVISSADAAAKYVYLSSKDGEMGGGLVLRNGYDLKTLKRVLYGDPGNPACTTGSLLDVGPGSSVICTNDFGTLSGYGINSFDTQEIILSGTIETLNFNVHAGIFDVQMDGAGVLKVTGNVDVTSSLTINFDAANDALASLVMASTEFDELIAGSYIKIDGAVAAASDFNTADAGAGLTQYTMVPEPATMALLGLGALVLRRKR